MMELTPLDVRKKKGDFRKGFRGYEPEEVDAFLDLAADRIEALVRENSLLKERAAQATEGLAAFKSREQAVNEALVTAQQLREEVKGQAQREADLTIREAKAEGERLVSEARRQLEQERDALQRAQAQRNRFLRSYRTFLEGQLAEVLTEEERTSRSRSGSAQPEQEEASAST